MTALANRLGALMPGADRRAAEGQLAHAGAATDCSRSMPISTAWA